MSKVFPVMTYGYWGLPSKHLASLDNTVYSHPVTGGDILVFDPSCSP
ncbi:MAG: hypothetical protein KGI27_15340 [Thaumarchaeota archaeon]|nr:hypothetical protein [Nitrososphaerota archaeon]MDE1816522.1 hypothetical protein [Nitrososphaerota archaeon]